MQSYEKMQSDRLSQRSGSGSKTYPISHEPSSACYGRDLAQDIKRLHTRTDLFGFVIRAHTDEYKGYD